MKLNFGCGSKAREGYVNVDIQEADWIDKSFNFEKTPYPFKENQFTYVISEQVLEHVGNLPAVFDELHRICKNNAIIEITVPYVGSKSAYFDLGHKSFFNDKSFTSICGNDNYDVSRSGRQRFKIKNMYIHPQRYLRWLHPKILKILATFLNNIYVQIDVKIQVIK
ncbi:class I SAM-dependent methyltransferase [Candidatus Pacearchaeota archaeon]|nr:class I SAM-dependent methyltransferase [Candidatus Pacearchaeota archaeon]